MKHTITVTYPSVGREFYFVDLDDTLAITVTPNIEEAKTFPKAEHADRFAEHLTHACRNRRGTVAEFSRTPEPEYEVDPFDDCEPPPPLVERLDFPDKEELVGILEEIKRNHAFDEEVDPLEEEVPSLCITLGVGEDGNGIQTGDNSYSGAAYPYPYWGVEFMMADTDCGELADDLMEQIRDLAAH